MSLEQLSDPDLSYLAVENMPYYSFVVGEEKVDVYQLMFELYDIDEEVASAARKVIIDCLYIIANKAEIDEQNNNVEDDTYNPPGFNYPGRQ